MLMRGHGWGLGEGLTSEIRTTRLFLHEERGDAMAATTKRMLGLALAILGLAVLILNAADYLLRWNRISAGLAAIGLMLVFVGASLARTPQVPQ